MLSTHRSELDDLFQSSVSYFQRVVSQFPVKLLDFVQNFGGVARAKRGVRRVGEMFDRLCCRFKLHIDLLWPGTVGRGGRSVRSVAGCTSERVDHVHGPGSIVGSRAAGNVATAAGKRILETT